MLLKAKRCISSAVIATTTSDPSPQVGLRSHFVSHCIQWVVEEPSGRGTRINHAVAGSVRDGTREMRDKMDHGPPADARSPAPQRVAAGESAAAAGSVLARIGTWVAGAWRAGSGGKTA